MGQYANELYAQNASLQCENKALKNEVAEFKNGKRYIKLQNDHKTIVSGYQRVIRKLKSAVAKTQDNAAKDRDMWIGQCDSDWEWYQSELAKKDKEVQRLEERNWETVRACDAKILALEKQHDTELREKDEEISKRDAIIEELKAKVAYQEALLNRNGENAGIPTSQTKIGQKKRNPNSREDSDNPKGGQTGHKQHVLEPPSEEEINDTVEHKLDEGAPCSECGSTDLIYTGKQDDRYEYDVKITVIKRHHIYYLYKCLNCGAIIESTEGPDFRWSQCLYGSGVQAIALSLMNTVNAPMNKTSLFIEGVSGGELTPSDGFIAKLQPRAAGLLDTFCAELWKKVISLPIVYWDDTVIMVDTKRACFRFYGDESIAYYTAHEKKDFNGLLEDNVLPMLTEDTWCMHDHNKVNYNEMFHFKNLECDQHLERDCQKNTDNTGHTWSTELKELTSKTIKDRNVAADAGEPCFSEERVKAFNLRLDEIIKKGWAEYDADAKRLEKYGAKFERALLNRMEEYRQNYFAWLEDFSLPTTNNVSERALRCQKTRMKVSGQYESIEYAVFSAKIRTYIETCRRQGKNEIEALQRLMDGNPFTVEELFGQ